MSEENKNSFNENNDVNVGENNININENNACDAPETQNEKDGEERANRAFDRIYCDPTPNETVGEPIKKRRTVSLATFVLSSIALVLAAVMVTWTVCVSAFRQGFAGMLGGDQGTTLTDFSALGVVESLFENYSYFDVDGEKTVDSVIKGYAAATGDRYAEYYTAEEFEAFFKESAGNSEGIGINIIYTTETIEGIEYKVVKVTNVTRESPAQEAGIKVGDLVFYVGTDPETRESIDAIGYSAAYSKLVGEAGTKAEFTVLRKTANGEYEVIPFSVTRRSVKTDSVFYHICATDPKVGIVKISGFDYTTPTQFSYAVDDLKSLGAEKFIFDVRYNGGGDLGSIVAVLSYFLEEDQTVISTLDKSGKSEVIKVGVVDKYEGEAASCNVSKSDIGKYADLKVAVLCNESTASAAELFVANFRDHKLGKTVGTVTFGKGSMQSILSLDYFGYGGGIKLTTNMYFPPCGESYEGIGITPDIQVSLDESLRDVNIYDMPDADDNQLQAAIKSFE